MQFLAVCTFWLMVCSPVMVFSPGQYCFYFAESFNVPYSELLNRYFKGTIRESLYPRKLILALDDRESLSPRKFIPAKLYTNKVSIVLHVFFGRNDYTFSTVSSWTPDNLNPVFCGCTRHLCLRWARGWTPCFVLDSVLEPENRNIDGSRSTFFVIVSFPRERYWRYKGWRV